MNTSDQLFIIEEIKNLKARYFRSIDFKDYELLLDTFAPDVVVDYRGSTTDPTSGINYNPGGTEATFSGGVASARMIIDVMAHLVSVHHGHMPEITVTSDTTAQGIWSMEDRLYFPETAPIKALIGFGYYYENYTRIDGSWKIQSISLKRLKIDIVE